MLRTKARNQIADTNVDRLHPGADLIELELQGQLAKSYSQERKEKLTLEVISRLQQAHQMNSASNAASRAEGIKDGGDLLLDGVQPSMIMNQPGSNTAQRLRAALRLANTATDGRPLLSSEELPPPDHLNASVDNAKHNNVGIFIPNADYEPTASADQNESAVAGDKLEAATADIILSEYPIDCFPEHWYERFPCCLEDTTFWRRWKKIRYVCVCVCVKYQHTPKVSQCFRFFLISMLCI